MTIRLSVEAILNKIKLPELQYINQLEQLLEMSEDPVYGDDSISRFQLKKYIQSAKLLRKRDASIRRME